MANFLKRLIFNRGGIGKAMGRAETLERLNPLLEQLTRLNRSYDYSIEHLTDAEIARSFARFQKIARADAGKLSETILSAGGVAYTGTDLEPEDFDLGPDDGAMLRALRDLEQAFYDAVTDERDLDHHMRTDAILQVVQKNSEARLDYIDEVTPTE